jgi:hypothetical protein
MNGVIITRRPIWPASAATGRKSSGSEEAAQDSPPAIGRIGTVFAHICTWTRMTLTNLAKIIREAPTVTDWAMQ